MYNNISYMSSSLISGQSQIASPSLSEEQLNDLLDMCARTISRTTAETESIAQTTAR